MFRHLLTGVFAGALLAVVFIAGFLTHAFFGNRLPLVVGASGSNGEYPLLQEVQGLLDHAYLREQPDSTTREYGAIKGLMATLEEPNTFFIEPPVAQSEADVLAGTYGGIGVLLQRNETGEFIMHPYPNSPAEAAGIEPGDVLVAINGVEITLQDHPDAVDQQLRGEVKEGSGVEIRFRDDDEEQELFIPFDVINVPSVLWRILEEDTRLGYVQ
ncbi:MAG: PDZ domain-containing protein, partial [Anaerolineae bacterium]|nr:PDZ domain-containing protein [Anaerolineae bacterium]